MTRDTTETDDLPDIYRPHLPEPPSVSELAPGAEPESADETDIQMLIDEAKIHILSHQMLAGERPSGCLLPDDIPEEALELPDDALPPYDTDELPPIGGLVEREENPETQTPAGVARIEKVAPSGAVKLTAAEDGIEPAKKYYSAEEWAESGWTPQHPPLPHHRRSRSGD